MMLVRFFAQIRLINSRIFQLGEHRSQYCTQSVLGRDTSNCPIAQPNPTAHQGASGEHLPPPPSPDPWPWEDQDPQTKGPRPQLPVRMSILQKVSRVKKG
jgi:hypothetical protein